ncbi:MAG: WD repeat domain phosphoinositide-interacting protein 2 [Stictis urceolatum]|nr:WD repeat domain phosphoinositide-interacting protein 2 [Stictis urceolata]
MSFNTTSSLLCVSSATETIHIFKLGGTQRGNSVDSKRPDSSNSFGARDRSLSPEAADSHTDLSPGTADESEDTLSPFQRKHNGTFMGMIRRTSQNVGSTLASSVGSYLPTSVAEMWEPSRDFAWCKIPKPTPNSGTSPSSVGTSSSLRSVVAMSNTSPQVMVVTNEGHFYVFGIDLEKGGEGTLVKTYEVANDNERMGASAVEE